MRFSESRLQWEHTEEAEADSRAHPIKREDMPPSLRAILEASDVALAAVRAELEALTSRIITIADEALGPFPVQTANEALSCIEQGFFDWRKELNRARDTKEGSDAKASVLREGQGGMEPKSVTPPPTTTPGYQQRCTEHGGYGSSKAACPTCNSPSTPAPVAVSRRILNADGTSRIEHAPTTTPAGEATPPVCASCGGTGEHRADGAAMPCPKCNPPPPPQTMEQPREHKPGCGIVSTDDALSLGWGDYFATGEDGSRAYCSAACAAACQTAAPPDTPVCGTAKRR